MHGNLFRLYLGRLREEEARLYIQTTPDIDGLVRRYRSTWENASRGSADASEPEIVEYANLLGRVAERYAFYDIAEEMFNHVLEYTLSPTAFIRVMS
jgi:hypothetical protein